MPASTAAFMNMSSVSFGKGVPRNSEMRRMRRLSPQKTRNTGAWGIHGIDSTSPLMAPRCAASRTITMLACCRSDFAGEDNAAARTISSVS